MLYLKEANERDKEMEFLFITNQPPDENGFINFYHGVSKAEFEQKALKEIMAHARGEQLKEGWVPETYFFLWKDAQIVGLFKIRHFLNESLKNGSGHIGYGIAKEFRQRGYGKKGLELAIEKGRNIIAEDEIYMSLGINNIVSLNVQLENGAYIHHQDEKKYNTRIKIG